MYAVYEFTKYQLCVCAITATLWGHGVIQTVRRWGTEIRETQVDTRLRQRHGSYLFLNHQQLQQQQLLLLLPLLLYHTAS